MPEGYLETLNPLKNLQTKRNDYSEPALKKFSCMNFDFFHRNSAHNENIQFNSIQFNSIQFIRIHSKETAKSRTKSSAITMAQAFHQLF